MKHALLTSLLFILFIASPVAGEDIPKNGLHQEFFPNGKVSSEVNYRNGLKNGAVKTYYEDGQLKTEITYRQNKKHGDKKIYFPNGKLRLKSSYKNDIAHGLQQAYWINGELRIEQKMAMGKPIYYKEYSASGQLTRDLKVEQLKGKPLPAIK